MKYRKHLPVAGMALLLAACAAGYYWTRGGAAPRPAAPPLVNGQLLKTARQLSALADTSDEQDQARETLRLSDHELDLAFSTALRDAAVSDSPASTNARQRQLADRVSTLKDQLAGDQDKVAQLTKQAASSSAAADQLDFAKAQMELDQDDLDDAQQDLDRAGGDRHARLERALAAHEAAQQGAAPLPKPSPQVPADTLNDQARQWFSLHAKHSSLLAAAQQAAASAADLTARHNHLESQADAPLAATPDVARMHQLADLKKTLTEYDKRIQDCQQLAAAYQNWSALLETRQRALLHLLLRSLTAVFGIVVVLLLAHRLAIRLFHQQDRRKRHQMQVASALACQLIGVIAILLIAFGPPTQISTVLGLATAGLTVVLKDFIVGFIGWFVLMGRNGVRIGDWVEINGVGGEVIEIGALKTVLLEMGNWSNTGHPTGRRVSFSNSYAIEGHYFNFSTVGQWLWDELSVTVPAGGDPYQVAEQIRRMVERETAQSSSQAEQDWERVTHEYGVTKFSAKPAVDLRPGLTGLDVVVRYITRAPLRYEVKSRLFQSIVELLHTAAPRT